jgi:hypothetical protein
MPAGSVILSPGDVVCQVRAFGLSNIVTDETRHLYVRLLVRDSCGEHVAIARSQFGPIVMKDGGEPMLYPVGIFQRTPTLH